MVMSNNKREGLERLIYIGIGISWIFVAVVITLWIVSMCFFRSDAFAEGRCKDLDVTWTYKTSTGETGECSLPFRINIPLGDRIEFSATLPDDIGDDTYLSWLGGRSFTLYIDGAKRLSYDGGDAWLPGRIVKSKFFSIKLSRADCGKTILIVKDEPKSRNGYLGVFTYGNMLGIIGDIFADYGFNICAAFILFFISVVILLINTGIATIYKIDNLSFRLLGYGMMSVAVWVISDSFLYQTLFGDAYISGIISFMMTPIMPLVFVRYIDEVQKHRYQKVYIALVYVLLTDAIITTVLHFTDIASFELTMLANDIIIGAVSAVILFLIIKDATAGHLPEYKWVAIGIIGLILFSAFEMILINIYTPYSGGLFLTLGIYFLLICSMIHTIGDIITSEREKRAAIDASLVKSTFLANMSHEIRTPINSIMGMNEMILRENKDPDIGTYADHIKRSCNLLMSIIGDVLDFSKIETGKINIVSDPYSTGDLLSDLTNLLNEQAKAKSLGVELDISGDIPTVLEGDENRVKQVVINLITNAVKYTKTGHIGLTAYGTPVLDSSYELTFEVSDTGIGIKDDDQDKLFDSFTRVDQKKNRNIQGTGLGLAIVKALCNIMGGDITVKSKYGEGSVFTAKLIQNVVDPTPLGTSWKQVRRKEQERVEYRASFKAPGKRILAVDDNESNLMVIRQLLKKTELTVDLVDNGKDAIGLCREKKYDLILLDHMMPDLDGVDVLGVIRQRPSNTNYYTPIIVLTANATEGSRKEYIAAGFDDYISKPVSGEKLEEIMAKWILPAKEQASDGKKGNDIISGFEIDDSSLASESKPSSPNSDSASKITALEELLGPDVFKQVIIYCGGREFAGKVLAKIAEDSLKALDNMNNALGSEDFKSYSINAHSIKGMMASAGMETLRDHAKEHEFAAKEERIDYMREDYEAFAEEIGDFCRKVLECV